MTLRQVLADARKAIGALTIGEAAAVTAGLLGDQTAGYVAGAIGVANAVVVYLLKNTPPAGPDRMP